jgi:hypothetical protein
MLVYRTGGGLEVLEDLEGRTKCEKSGLKISRVSIPMRNLSCATINFGEVGNSGLSIDCNNYNRLKSDRSILFFIFTEC